MTYENCLKYAKEYKEAGDEKMALFWEERAKTKNKPVEVKEEVKEIKKSKGKK